MPEGHTPSRVAHRLVVDDNNKNEDVNKERQHSPSPPPARRRRRRRRSRRRASPAPSLLLLLGTLLASHSAVAVVASSTSPSAGHLASQRSWKLDSTTTETRMFTQEEVTALGAVVSGTKAPSLLPIPDDRVLDVASAAVARGGGSDGSVVVDGEGPSEFDVDDPWSRVGGGRVNERPRRQRTSTASAARTDIATAQKLSADSNARDAKDDNNPAYDPLRHKSHLWHALEGMDRYPRYLSRWNDVDDIARLENALQVQLDRVTSQKRTVQSYKQFVRNVVAHDDELRSATNSSVSVLSPPQSWQELRDRNILDPKLVDAILRSRQFRAPHPPASPPPSLEELWSGIGADIDLDVGLLVDLMDEEVPDVFALPILTPDFGSQLCDWIEAVSARVQHHLASRTGFSWNDQNTSATFNDDDWDSWRTQSRRPLDLSDVGLDWLVNLLFNVVVQPISSHLFLDEVAGDKGRRLDWRQAFVAGYSSAPATSGNAAAPRQHLVPHTDDSEVTLNVCLGRNFTGGVLEFGGLRGQSSPREPAHSPYEYEPQPGRGVIHAGRHFHSVSPVTSGSRYALILWARSWEGIRATTCPCCWLNRRTSTGAAQPCIASPQWN